MRAVWSPRVLVLFEIVLIAGLLVWIVKEKQNTRVPQTTSPIQRDQVAFSATDELEHFYEYKPEMSNNYTPEWLEGDLRNTINEDTLNERFDYTVEKNEGVYRIITLGDSWTFGQFVSTQHNFSEQLEDELNSEYTCKNIERFEVINLGVGGYDLAYSVERFKRRGVKYDPDLVIWLLIDNDFNYVKDFLSARIHEYQRRYDENEDDHIYAERKNDKELFVNTSDQSGIRAWQQAYEDQKKEFSEDDLTRYQREHFNRFATHHLGSTVLYTFKGENGHMLPPPPRARHIIRDFTATHEHVQWYESDLELDQEKERLPDSHPNEDGHYRISQDLLAYLMENTTLPLAEECRVRSSL